MAPTIGRQWRGGTQDYAALCDYCDVRYLRSQLRKQGNGRLGCVGPGTNGCGVGLDELSLDKVNADKMRHRRRPTKHDGGRFDRIRTTVVEIFGAQLVEYWDATVGVVSASDGSLTSWAGQKLGAVFTVGAGGAGRYAASVAEFYGRPAVQITALEYSTEVAALLPSGARPYIGAVTSSPMDEGNAIQFLSGAVSKAGIGRDPDLAISFSRYCSATVPTGTVLQIPNTELGNLRHARLYELDATGPIEFRAGTVETSSSVDSPTDAPWSRASLQQGCTVTLLVLANNPSPLQIEEFQSLARSYAVMRP